MLARIPEETAEERNAYYRDRTRDQMKAVDQDLMKEQHPSMPIENSRQSRVTFGGRSKDDSK
jgi:type VI protein secretion system component VasF